MLTIYQQFSVWLQHLYKAEFIIHPLWLEHWTCKLYLIQNSQAVKKSVALRKDMVKKDVKSKVAAKKWL